MTDTSAKKTTITLDDKYNARQGRVFINGNQALVRLPLLQQELDAKAGLNTAGYLTGYRGSPLGGLDSALWQEQQRLKDHNIIFQPGVNEDLAMTAVWGTQLLAAVDGPKYDGVFAYWYGKGPGVDRSGDPMKHGNNNGTNTHGGVLLLYGDDHPGKSSTVSHQSEHALAANGVPSLYPANVGEFIEFGLLGWAMSRYSGLWIGYKTVNETVEQTATVDMDLDNFQIQRPEREQLPDNAVNIVNDEWVFPAITHEINLNKYRYPLLHRFVRANPIDKTPVSSSRRQLGIVTAGKSYMDVMQALQMLGIDADRAEQLGLSVYKVGLIWPLEPEGLNRFAKGHQELFFVEEKKAFMEDQAARLLFNNAERPRITGKGDDLGNTLLAKDVQLEPLIIAQRIVERLKACGVADPALDTRLQLLCSSIQPSAPVASATRSPYFCSGCPHNTSTKVPEGSVAMAGIGCHAMAGFYRPDTVAAAQMGGEGAQWGGLHHFTERKHMFQNLGDGTYYHSGLMCVRNSVASGANITYKILYNDAVAMTGGQPIDGPISVYEMAHQVASEGISQLVLVSDQPEKFEIGQLPKSTTIHHRDDLDQVQRALREVEGTSVIIYEQTCAAEKRRRRKKGELPDPPKRLFINQEVCEGCGDCSVQSTCVSLQPLETDKGTKRAIDQNACNKDYSCNRGFCPSFVTVLGGELKKPEAAQLDDSLFAKLPEPVLVRPKDSYGIMVAGIGGTGVITVSAIIGMAAHIDGKACSIYDMTGLSQKNGAVFSHLKIAQSPRQLGTQKLGLGDASLLMGFDLVASVSDDAFRSLGQGTQILGNSEVAQTHVFQLQPGSKVDETLLVDRLSEKVGADHIRMVDATGIALKLLGNTIGANMFMVGYASQLGLLPVSFQALTRAIELNGTAVSFNQRAFKLGRLYAHSPKVMQAYLSQSDRQPMLPTTLEEARSQGIDWLTKYQNATYASRFTRLVDRVATAEQQIAPGSEKLAVATANSMAKLMAYKDEYEVARLYSDPDFTKRLQQQFQGNYRLRFNLAPPLLSRKDPTTGFPRKREFGSWMLPVFALLARCRVIRGSALDIFGYHPERKLERRLIDEFEMLMEEAATKLTSENLSVAVRLAELPMDIRGFGHVKAKNLTQVKQQQAVLLKELDSGPQVVQILEPLQAV